MDQLDTKKSGFVSIIGRPNVGKSTLLNHLVGMKIAITSNKPQTTRNNIRAILTHEEYGQAVFVDTPGIHKAKTKLGKFMVDSASRASRDVDLILWLVEPDDRIGGGDKHIIESLKETDLPIILIINKIDSVKNEDVFSVIETFKDAFDFAEVVPLSAKTGKNVEELIPLIFKYLPYGPAYYDEDEVTDQPMRQIVAEVIREKSLHALEDEIPHGIAVAIDKMEFRKTKNKKGIYDIDATIICERDSHKGIIIGKGGSMLKKIGTNARYECEHMLETKVNLHLFVKVKKDWRNSDFMIKNFGYTNDDDK